nr:immunoglobulin light chain junction region [Macaca mulatta]MOW06554.1 immunoglobulin light chain junction region [Macaca mulatta]
DYYCSSYAGRGAFIF